MKYISIESQKRLFRKHKSMTSKYDDVRGSFAKIRIAILSGITVHPLKDILELLLLEQKIDPIFFEGDYNSYQFEARYSEDLIEFEPDVIYLHSSIDNIAVWPEISMGDKEREKIIDVFWKENTQVIEAILSRSSANLILNNFEYPNFRINGNYEACADGGSIRYISSINNRLADFAKGNNRVALNDINYLSAKIGLEAWRDDNSYCHFKQPFTSRAIVEISRSIASLIKVLVGRVNKCFVLDLDDTMWGGIIGDVGSDNIQVGMETPSGEAYMKFQKAIKPLLGRGIGFAVCSKNEFETAKVGLNLSTMHIKEADFHILKINWREKSANIVDIQKALNIGLDSIVFLDDSEFEREEVGYKLPELNILDVKRDPFSYLQAISNEYAFETLSISQEDLERGKSFRGMMKFDDEISSNSGDDLNSFLISLKMTASISELNSQNEARIFQLINKTNQFNLTTKRVSAGDLEPYKNDKILLAATLADKNVNYGLISVLWGEIKNDVFVLDNWVMSCRVFNRKLEYFFFHTLYERLRREKVTKIQATFIKSNKNAPVENLLADLGLHLMHKDGLVFNYEVDIPNVDIEKLSELEDLYSWK